MKPCKLLFARECHICHVAPCAGFAANAFAEIVHNDEVKSWMFSTRHFYSSILQKDTVEDFDQVENANLHAGLFQQFTSDAILQRFAQFQRTAVD